MKRDYLPTCGKDGCGCKSFPKFNILDSDGEVLNYEFECGTEFPRNVILQQDYLNYFEDNDNVVDFVDSFDLPEGTTAEQCANECLIAAGLINPDPFTKEMLLGESSVDRDRMIDMALVSEDAWFTMLSFAERDCDNQLV